jgi:hypothetical protein
MAEPIRGPPSFQLMLFYQININARQKIRKVSVNDFGTNRMQSGSPPGQQVMAAPCTGLGLYCT